MPTLYFDLEDFDDEDEDDLYEGDALDTELPELDADEDDIICKQCGEIVEDGAQCSFCGWLVGV